jgi:tripartite ATP-independent transporter DctM subunit
MSGVALGALGLGAAIVLVVLRFPIAIALGLVGFAGSALIGGWRGAEFVIGSSPFEVASSYSLSVVPLFIMMGVFAGRAGLSASLYRAVNAYFGHIKGGLAVATIGACALFGAICGSSLATASTMGRIALPEMRRHGYADGFASASVAAGGTLGVLIPPSIILVIYALLTETSIGALFIAALLPGLLGVLLYVVAIVVTIRVKPTVAPIADYAQPQERLAATRNVLPVLGLFTVVIGGIYMGVFSPTEAAAIGALGTIVLAALGRSMSFDDLREATSETVSTTGMIFFVLIGAALFNYFIETTGMPTAFVQYIREIGLGPYGTLLLLMVFYIVLGCFMDALSMILLTIPIVFPVVSDLGVSPLWFGILIVTVTETGLITPPIGMNLFIIQTVADDIPMSKIIRGVIPFILADIARLALLVAFPAIALWLPQTTGM